MPTLKKIFLIVPLVLFAVGVAMAQEENQSSSEKKELRDLKYAVKFNKYNYFDFQNLDTRKNNSIMFAKKSVETPIFCRIEDKINEGNQLQCLFRLGSVPYNNYLEQKGDRQRLLLEQIQ
ncbi:hypothetical protein [Membranihabitans maritimus]|uniref:hypothetical protein n=1 Tax=Membranihabitans maritimus TaxID=2904244 RepID=UPI001F46D776|nr:hypothetical protein [Membranihabitans maritimus]